MDVKLACGIIAKNEAKFIENCLLSIAGCVDFVCLVDTGSSDNTVKLAQHTLSYRGYRNGESYVILNAHKVKDNFAVWRNVYMNFLHNNGYNWVLHLDADERLCGRHKGKLKKYIQHLTQGEDALAMWLLGPATDATSGLSHVSPIHKVKVSSTELLFYNSVHEGLSPKKSGFILDDSIYIAHLGYDIPVVDMKIKTAKYSNMLMQDLEKGMNWSTLYHLAKTFKNHGDINTAKYILEQILNLDELTEDEKNGVRKILELYKGIK